MIQNFPFGERMLQSAEKRKKCIGYVKKVEPEMWQMNDIADNPINSV